MQDGVDVAQELDRVQVLTSAILVRQPVAVVARIVEVQHGCNGIDPQPVDMELLQPVHRVGQQKIPDLASAIVEHQGTPFAVLAASRVGMFVHRLAGEAGKREIVLGEVAGYPVQDHADAGAMTAVDQITQIVRSAEARTRGIVTGDLVTPRLVQRVLHDRQEFDMGVAEIGDIGDELVRHRPEIQEAAVGPAPPGPGVDLVDAHGLMHPVPFGPVREPIPVLPFEGAWRDDARGGVRAHGHRLAVGICLDQALPLVVDELELIEVIRHQAGYEELPDPGCAPVAHGMPESVPAVEIADHACASQGRCPDGEAATADAVDFHGVRAQQAVDVVVSALAEQVQVEIRQQGGETVRRYRRVALVVALLEPVEPIVGGEAVGLRGAQGGLEYIGVGQPAHGADALELDLLRARHERPHQETLAVRLLAQN